MGIYVEIGRCGNKVNTGPGGGMRSHNPQLFGFFSLTPSLNLKNKSIFHDKKLEQSDWE